MSDDDKGAARGTVYVVPEYRIGGDISGCLLRDNGEVPWSHMSSSINWLQRDLTNGFSDRRTQLEAWYPNGYDVVVVTEGVEIPADVLERNAAQATDTAAPVEGSSQGETK